MYDDLTQEVEQFLYREARLLDERRFNEWLELFTDDARYWVGGRINRYPKTSKAIAILDSDRHVEQEDPPSRTRHLVANIKLEPGDAVSELKVYCNFIVYRSPAETEKDFYVGARRDVLRLVDGAWKIARRKLTLDQNVLAAKNVSIFF